MIIEKIEGMKDTNIATFGAMNLQLFADTDNGADTTASSTDTTTTDANTDTTDVDNNSSQITEEQMRAKLKAEIEAETQKEIDRRITEAVKKREAKLKADMLEKERLAKLSEEEKIKELERKRAEETAQKEKDLNIKELKLGLYDVLTEKKLDLAFRDIIDVEGFLGVEAEDRMDSLTERVSKVEEIFNALVNKRVEEFKAEYLKGRTPDNLGKKDNVKTLSEYEQAQKKGDVTGMLKSKFAGKI